jgi:prevent-host-death family protein
VKTFSVHAAKTHLSRLIERVERGEEIVIRRRNTPVAKLVAVSSPGTRKFGALRGKAKTTRAFFEPLPDAELEAWER